MITGPTSAREPSRSAMFASTSAVQQQLLHPRAPFSIGPRMPERRGARRRLRAIVGSHSPRPARLVKRACLEIRLIVSSVPGKLRS